MTVYETPRQEEIIASLPAHLRAFVKVQDGCRYRCSYCVVTLARGEARSDDLGLRVRVGQVRLLYSDEVEPVNIGNPHEMTILEFAKHIRKLTGGTSEIVYEPLPLNDPKTRQPDITMAREHLGWEPRVPIEEGLRRTHAYFVEQLAREYGPGS